MRIVHLSDIHLSKYNCDDFEFYYIPALIKDLKNQSFEKSIDIIVITGDLVDRGGRSLINQNNFDTKDLNPYHKFEEMIINPISQELEINKSNILFTPGNHDVDESEILLVDEKKLESELDERSIKDILKENATSLKYSKRIKAFKEFEQEFHSSTPNYNFSYNQSTFHYTDKDDLKVGFILINDSWRCKSIPLWSSEFINKGDHKHYVGVQQFHDGLKEIEMHKTDVNVCLMHHDLNCFKDKDAIERILINKNIDMVLFGHYHSTESIVPNHLIGCYLSLRCRASHNINENESLYRVGYQIIDLKGNYAKKIIYRIFNKNSAEFVEDTDGGFKNGVYDNNGSGIELHQRIRVKQKLNKDDFQN